MGQLTGLDKNNFAIKLVLWLRIFGFVSGMIWIGFAIAIFISIMTGNFDVISIIVMVVALLLFTILIVWFLWMPLRLKIIVKDNMIIYHKSRKKVVQIAFDEISKATTGEYQGDGYVNCYDKDGKMIFTFSGYWTDHYLLIQQLIYSGKIPEFETPDFLRNGSNEKQLKKFLHIATALMTFLIEQDLTSWCFLDENGLVEADFKLFHNELTAEGQYLFASGVVDKWINSAQRQRGTLNFNLLKDALMEFENQ